MSTSTPGRITSSFIRSMSVVPPASGWIAASVNGSLPDAAAASACTADGTSTALWYINGRMRLTFLLVGRNGRCGLFHGRNDVRISSAAADVATHVLANIVVAAGVTFLHATHCRHDLSRGAITALERILLDKGLLHWMQLIAFCESLDGEDLLSLRRKRQRQTGHHPTTINQDGAGTALTVVTTFFAAIETDVLA